MFEKIDLKDFAPDPVRMIGEGRILLSAGARGDFNTMTVNWGGMGFLWNMPVAFVFIRPSRYTFDFVEQSEYFTLSRLPPEYGEALKICGTKSGRDIDKIAESKLTPFYTALGNPVFAEAEIAFECRKIYAQTMETNCFTDFAPVKMWYADGECHKMFVAEMVNIFKKTS